MRAPQIKIDWTPERFNALRRLALAGKTSYEISAELGISRSAVVKKCWVNGIKLRGRDRYQDKKPAYSLTNPLELSYY